MRVFIKICIIALALYCSLPIAQAEFIQTGSYFQSTDGHTKVIPTDKGIFFLFSSKTIPLQTFNVANVKEGLSVFLEFDSTQNRYSALHVGASQFAIRGSFSLKIGELSVKVDNFSNPYCTAEISPKNTVPAIVAFQGITPVGSYAGTSAAAILSANQIFTDSSGIHPYELSANKTLTLNGEVLPTAEIGLDVPPPNNACLNPTADTLFLYQSEMNKIRAVKDEAQRKELLKDAIKKNKINLLGTFVILTVKKNVTALDPRDSSIKIIEQISSDPKICEIQSIDLS